MTILTRLFGGRKTGTISTSRIEKVTSSRPKEDFARPARSQVYREATVHLESGYRRRGIVLDYTDNGLRIRFPTNEIMPRFLKVSALSIGVEGRAEVVWQKGPEVGLKLL